MNKFSRLNIHRYYIKNNELLYNLNFTKNNYLKYTKNIPLIKKKDKNINPLIWQLGHVNYFYNELVLKNLNINLNIKELDDNYDSYKTPLKYREEKISYNDNIEIYKDINNKLVNYINKNNTNYVNSYLIMLGILHNDMHTESFIFTKYDINNKLDYNINNYSDILIKEIEYIKYSKGNFKQGSLQLNNNHLIFDNEMPYFTKNVDDFRISKYPITEYQYLQFIENKGYEKKEYWCRNGYNFIKENNIRYPKNWEKKEKKYYKKINNKYYSVETNLPVINISYYEASAFCKWNNGRLPTESEYEYISTNGGLTKYPWGNHLIDNYNLDYKNYIVPVNSYKNNENYKSVKGLIGNVWEWCDESIYPYDGFKIDPIYKEMSYPYFGFKKICKGGSFATPFYLIHPKYRNAQYPDCRNQFIGFRICKI